MNLRLGSLAISILWYAAEAPGVTEGVECNGQDSNLWAVPVACRGRVRL